MINHFEIQDFFTQELSEDLIKKWNTWCYQNYGDNLLEDYMDTYDIWYDEVIMERIIELIMETDSSNYDEDLDK